MIASGNGSDEKKQRKPFWAFGILLTAASIMGPMPPTNGSRCRPFSLSSKTHVRPSHLYGRITCIWFMRTSRRGILHFFHSLSYNLIDRYPPPRFGFNVVLLPHSRGSSM